MGGILGFQAEDRKSIENNRFRHLSRGGPVEAALISLQVAAREMDKLQP
jgi:hypothetical protein